jgi:hypothetical protein
MERRVRPQLLLVGIALASVLALGPLLGGCGSSGSDSRPEPPLPTKKQFAHKLGDLCQEHTDRQAIAVERYEKQHGIPEEPSGKQVEQELVQVILPIVRSTIHEAGMLRPPASEKPEFEAFIEALEHGVAVSERDPSWVATNKFEPFMRARETSAALGTYYCGQA